MGRREGQITHSSSQKAACAHVGAAERRRPHISPYLPQLEDALEGPRLGRLFLREI